MKLIVISNPTTISNEHQLLNSLFDNGLERFHLRKPDFSLQEMETYIQQVPLIYRSKIVLHSHHELVDKYQLKGKHKTSVAIDNVGNTQYISTSIHSLNELIDCNNAYEYVFLSPVFDSISKKGYKSNFDTEELKHFFKNKTSNGSFSFREVIALGGINQYNAQTALQIGFSGVAVLGSIWLSDNPVNAFKEISASCKTNLYQVNVK